MTETLFSIAKSTTSSTIGYVVYSLIFGAQQLFTVPEFTMEINYIPYLILIAVFAGLIKSCLKEYFNGCLEFFENSRVPPDRPYCINSRASSYWYRDKLYSELHLGSNTNK
ncbi:chloride channel protein [Natranaerobius trueperi]|uniref:chloride channel protein n=1 Tax=Natranaerobius trueperi TaxID=759412 RepID=UPI00146E38B0|nr:chloride channel protein [Natranaerobius trueperi]